MTPDLSRPGDIPDLRRIWKRSFGDTDEFLDQFFTRLYHPEDVFVIREDGQVRAMAFQLPMTICQNGRGWRAGYLYAVATDEMARGKGLCTRLLDHAGDVLAGRGCKALLLVPAEAGLREFYMRRGFVNFSEVMRFMANAAAGPGTAERIEAAEYLELRERLLEGRAYVSCPMPVLSFQKIVAGLYGGGLFRISCGGLEGCACAALDEFGRAAVHELLWPGEPMQGAALAIKAVGAERGTVRMPGKGRKFAMVRWLCEPPALDDPYLGIALD